MNVAVGLRPPPKAMSGDLRRPDDPIDTGWQPRWRQCKEGSKGHQAVDRLGSMLPLHVMAASEQDRAPVERLAQPMQEVTGETMEVAFVGWGCTGEQGCPGRRQRFDPEVLADRF